MAVGGLATINGKVSAFAYVFDYTNCLIKSKMSWSSAIATSTLGIQGISFDVTDNTKLWMVAYEVSGTTVKEYLITSDYDALSTASAFLVETLTSGTNYGLKPTSIFGVNGNTGFIIGQKNLKSIDTSGTGPTVTADLIGASGNTNRAAAALDGNSNNVSFELYLA